jgi:hypothetical protein
MNRATYNGWLLETASGNFARCDGSRTTQVRAWVSSPDRILVGYGSGACQVDAVRMALVDAGSHWAKDCDALTGLEAEYFGPLGMLATAPRK